MLSNGEPRAVATPVHQTRLSRALRMDWLGQTAASLFWMVSVFVYGISSVGDWLQLFAASAWFLANIATIVSVEGD